MNRSELCRGPVIIGGVGGSGTRVIAEIVARFGFYLGDDLNSASDNLTYTLLFKRPAWFRKNYPVSRQFYRGFTILQKTLLTGKPFTIRERWFLRSAAKEMSNFGHNREGQGKGEWPAQRLEMIARRKPLDAAKYCGWGWKEPNSHLALEAIQQSFPEFKYIHTIRHGLDMAYSSNQQQLYNWASLYGITLPENPGDVPAASFRFWVEANRRVVDIGRKLGPEKFLLINYDELCHEPLPGIMRLAVFLGVKPEEEVLAEAASLPRVPETVGRYKKHTGFVVSEEDRLFLQEMGFRI